MLFRILLILLVGFFALNMGGGNFGAAFAAAHGGRILSKKKSQLLFLIFVILGALTFGSKVTETLGAKIIPVELLTIKNVCIILISASSSLFIANRLNVPQSTSFVAIGSILGIGLYRHSFYCSTLVRLLPYWIGLPLLGFILTYLLGRLIYPPRQNNFRIFEKLVNHHIWLRRFVIASSCYNAFSVGSNNVANAVGPLAGAGIVPAGLGLLLVSPVFGFGGILFDKSLTVTGDKIAPLGLLTATITCLVCATLMIIASVCGVPQSFVMIKVASVVAIGLLKNGSVETLCNPVIIKTYLTWFITPAIAIAMSYFMLAGYEVFCAY